MEDFSSVYSTTITFSNSWLIAVGKLLLEFPDKDILNDRFMGLSVYDRLFPLKPKNPI